MALHIETSGHGPSLVLLHGWALHGGVFAPLVEQLRERFTLHVVDLPGHGRSRDDSPAFSLNAVVDEVAERTPPATWIGWSIGGLFALKATTLHEQVRGLVMLAATPCPLRRPDWPHAAESTTLENLANDLHRDWQTTLERFFTLDTQGSETATARWRALRPAVLAGGAPSAAAIDDGLRLLMRTDLRHLLPGLRVPSLWLAGQRDRLSHSQALQAAAQAAPRATYTELPGVGHAAFIRNPEAVASSLAGFATAALA